MQKTISLILLLLLSACSNLKVTQDHVPGYDYNKLKTYSLLPRTQEYSQSLTQSAITLDRIEAALVQELGKRYQRLDYQTQHTDFVVAYHLVTTSEYRYDSQGYFSGWNRGMFNHSYHERRYEVGNLIVDIYDANSRKQIWHGVVSSRVKTKQTPHERQQEIKKAVGQLLSNFPSD